MLFARKKAEMTDAARALPGRSGAIATASQHFVNGNPLKGPYPAGSEQIVLAMGCYWGAERKFWEVPGIWVTAVGNAGGFTPNPTYEEVCSGLTGHTESVLVVFEPSRVSLNDILKVFWESHDPTQGMRQGNDTGTQYRSAIYWNSTAQRDAIAASKAAYQAALAAQGHGAITTEIAEAGPFYFAETYHQQYLAKNPHGYCGLGGTGVVCAIGTGVSG
ncbi:MAG: peptide-methionine (S)-S-oxide reductase MsrA [Aestuariivirga sp.]